MNAPWVEWVNGARRGEASSREELISYFTPFIHGVLLTRLAPDTASAHVRLVVDLVLRGLAEPYDASTLGSRVLAEARRCAEEVSQREGNTLELPGAGVHGGERVLAKLVQLEASSRERLLLRLLEGISGEEIAEVSGADAAAVRSDLERATASLVNELTGQVLSLAGDRYLWSLMGAPHPAVVRLENELTALRFDASAPASGPPSGALRPVVPVSSDETTGSGPALEITAVGARLVLPPEPQTESVVPRIEDERTAPAGKPLNPFDAPAETRLVSDLPAAAKPDPGAAEGGEPSTDPKAPLANPFVHHAETQAASDLPAAAQEVPEVGTIQHYDVVRPVPIEPAREVRPLTASTRNERASGGSPVATPGTPGPPPAVEVTPTVAPPPRPSAPSDTVDGDSTAPRGVPLSVISKNWRPPERPSQPRQPLTAEDWRVGGVAVTPVMPQRAKQFALTRGATPFVSAAVLLAFAGVGIWVGLRSTESAIRRPWNLVPIAVAAENIPEGTTVTSEMIARRDVPEQFVTSSVVKPDAVAYIKNQRIMVPVQAGDPLLWSEFETAYSNERLSNRVHRQGRAYTLDTEPISSVGGWVQPGDHIDLVVVMGVGELTEPVTFTTLQNLQVLATGRITPKTDIGSLKAAQREYQNVSLLALPEEVEMLALTRMKASYVMVLRNDEDFDHFETKPKTPSTVINPGRAVQLSKRRAQEVAGVKNHIIEIPKVHAPWVDPGPATLLKPVAKPASR